MTRAEVSNLFSEAQQKLDSYNAAASVYRKAVQSCERAQARKSAAFVEYEGRFEQYEEALAACKALAVDVEDEGADE